VVNAVDEIIVELVGGTPVTARVVSSEPAADLSLPQLERIGNMNAVRRRWPRPWFP
jgi:hypothetical protein